MKCSNIAHTCTDIRNVNFYTKFRVYIHFDIKVSYSVTQENSHFQVINRVNIPLLMDWLMKRKTGNIAMDMTDGFILKYAKV